MTKSHKRWYGKLFSLDETLSKASRENKLLQTIIVQLNLDCVLGTPVDVGGCLRVDPGVAGLRAAPAPRDDPAERV